jgi:hypothetical protein
VRAHLLEIKNLMPTTLPLLDLPSFDSTIAEKTLSPKIVMPQVRKTLKKIMSTSTMPENASRVHSTENEDSINYSSYANGATGTHDVMGKFETARKVSGDSLASREYAGSTGLVSWRDVSSSSYPR